MVGAKLILPGPGLDGASLLELIEQQQASLLLGVPTVWLGLLNHMNSVGKKLQSVKNVVIGGSAAPYSMIKEFQEQHDVFVIHAWGMTETSPLGTINSPADAMEQMPLEQRYRLQMKQGRPVYGVQLKIVNDDNQPLPHDGSTFGRLLIRGPWVANGYYGIGQTESFQDGWFDTGDVATIDPQGYMQIVDRTKDVIKSGGEWISSIDLENAALGHPAVAEACVIGVRHPKWDERPLLLAVLHPGSACQPQQLIEFLSDKVAKWWLPDAVLFVDELPHTATGKLLKTELREIYQDHLL